MDENNPSPSRMQWFFIILLALWLLASITGTVLVFCITRSPLSFSLYSTLAPPVYFSHRMIKYAFPKNREDYALAEAKLRCKAQIAEAKYAASKRKK